MHPNSECIEGDIQLRNNSTVSGEKTQGKSGEKIRFLCALIVLNRCSELGYQGQSSTDLKSQV